MRKVSSKPFLQPQNTSQTINVDSSPNITKQQSMIHLYKTKLTSNQNALKPNININPQSIIQKAITSRRQTQTNVLQPKVHNYGLNNYNSMKEETTNKNKYTAKHMSPTEGKRRLNDTLDIDKNLLNKRQKSPFTYQTNEKTNQPNSHEGQKNEDLNSKIKQMFNKTLAKNPPQHLTPFTTALKIDNQQLIKGKNAQREKTRRGAQFNDSGQSKNVQDSSLSGGGNSNMFKYFPNNTLNKNKSAFLNFNQTQPILQHNRTQINLRNNELKKESFLQNKMIYNQSPSISSEEENQEEGHINIAHQRMASLYQENSLLKRIQNMPNGSFVETKMANCIQSRNKQQDLAQQYNTHSGTTTQKTLLQKNSSQPQLLKACNLTQRPTFTKTSFANRDTAVTPIVGKPQSNGNTASNKKDSSKLKSGLNRFNRQPGQDKSLNLSPIIPQNLGKTQQQFSNNRKNTQVNDKSIQDYHTTLDTTCKKQKPTDANVLHTELDNNRSYTSQLKQEPIILKKKNTGQEPTTEKKKKSNFLSFNQQKGGCDKVTEKTTTAAGGVATNSYSTADDFQLRSTKDVTHKNSDKSLLLRVQNYETNREKLESKLSINQMENLVEILNQETQAIRNHHQQIIQTNTQNIVKVNQILNNNKAILPKRYNAMSSGGTPENLISQTDTIFCEEFNHKSSQITQEQGRAQNQTPRAIPMFDAKFPSQGSNKSNHNESCSVSEDDVQDSKDFEEFDRSHSSYQNLKENNKMSKQNGNKNQILQSISDDDMKIKVQVVDQQYFKEINSDSYFSKQHNSFKDYKQNGCYGFIVKDDRDSIVNYDQSILTLNTRGNLSPDNEFKNLPGQLTKKYLDDENSSSEYQSEAEEYCSKGGNIMKPELNGVQDIQYTKTNDDYYDTDYLNQNPNEDNFSQQEMLMSTERKSNEYLEFLSQIQQKEEEAISQLTKRVKETQEYRMCRNEYERSKFLAGQIIEVRKRYKQILLENILKQAKQ